MYRPSLDPIGLDVSDEQVISFLDGFKTGALLPENVVDDINPFQFQPSNLPDGIWYVVHSNMKKENDFGFWEGKEEASEVFRNSSISGWRRTQEFFEFVDYAVRRTDWVMQEYTITQKRQCGTDKEKELRAMCKIFCSVAATRANKEDQSKPMAAANEGKNHSSPLLSIAPSSNSNFGKVSTSGSLVTVFQRSKANPFSKMKTTVDGTSEDNKLLDPQQRDIFELHAVLDGDYLEWDDLADPLSHSSSSDNSCHSSMTFDEYFDPVAFLRELEDNSNNQGHQGKDSSSRCIFTASISPFEVVMQPATSRPLVCDTVKQEPSGYKQASSVIETKFHNEILGNHRAKRLKAEPRDEDPLSSRGAVASSSTSAAPAPIGKKEAAAAAVNPKGLKKYFCFLPF